MKTVLFINSIEPNCGIYQFGARVYDTIKDSPDINYIYKEPKSLGEYMNLLRSIKPDFVLLNWYHTVMNWLEPEYDIPSKIPHYFIFHERPIRKHYDKMIFFGDYGIKNGYIDNINSVIPEKSIILPRPLFDYTNVFPKNDVPNIGFFGLMISWSKGFDTVVTRVNQEFDEAIINMHMVWSPFCDPTRELLNGMVEKCIALNKKPGIKLHITHDLMSNRDLLDFLGKNDLNLCIYNQLGQYGLSSSVDYCLSVQRPLGIDTSDPFRHMIKDEINIDKHSLKEIINLGTTPLEDLYEKWSPSNLKKEMDKLFI